MAENKKEENGNIIRDRLRSRILTRYGTITRYASAYMIDRSYFNTKLTGLRKFTGSDMVNLIGQNLLTEAEAQTLIIEQGAGR